MRDSPLLACFAAAEFTLGECGDTRVALRTRAVTHATTYVADLSGQRKCLVVGRGAPALLGSRALPTPEWFAMAPTADDGWVVRIGARRFLVSAGPGGGAEPPLSAGRWADDTLVVAQDSAEIALGGEHAIAVLSEFCALDLEHTVSGTWVPAQCATLEVGLYRPAAGPAQCFHLVCAPADAGALFRVLLEAVRAHAGAPIGYADYLSKNSRGEVA